MTVGKWHKHCWTVCLFRQLVTVMFCILNYVGDSLSVEIWPFFLGGGDFDLASLWVRYSAGIGIEDVGRSSKNRLERTFITLLILKFARPFWICLSHVLSFSSLVTPNHCISDTCDRFRIKSGLFLLLLQPPTQRWSDLPMVFKSQKKEAQANIDPN